MISSVIIALFSLIGLVALHEFGHFIMAKKFGVKVEEFGIGYPPRIFGKKIGDTLYSLNLLPFGAFVKMPGETEESEDPRSFFKKPLWQRATIVAAGVISFWMIAVIIFSALMIIGAPMAVSDTETEGIINPKVQIALISKESPAEKSGLKMGDNIISIQSNLLEIQAIDKVSQLQDFINLHRGEELNLTVAREENIFTVLITPRITPPSGEGPLGVALNRVAIKSYSWWQAPWQGVKTTFYLTKAIIFGYANVISNVFQGAPTGVELLGPVGIVKQGASVVELGFNYFLLFIGQIAVYVAIGNILPIPALDGGKLLFLGIEAVRRKPMNQRIEQSITAVFFGLLILIMIFVTIKDIIK